MQQQILYHRNSEQEIYADIPYHVHAVIYSIIKYNDRMVTKTIQVMSMKLNDLVGEHTFFQHWKK